MDTYSVTISYPNGQNGYTGLTMDNLLRLLAALDKEIGSFTSLHIRHERED